MSPAIPGKPTGIRQVILSASNPDALVTKCQSTLTDLESADPEPHYQTLLEDSVKPSPEDFARMGFVSESVAEAAMLLQSGLRNLEKKREETAWTLRKGVHYRRQAMDSQSKVVALFPGQGSQYVSMLEVLHTSFPTMATCFETMDTLFQKEGLEPLTSIVFPPPTEDKSKKKEQETRLTLTEHAQPAIGAASVGLYKILQAAGLKAQATVGHSFGEVTALWAAGVFSDADYFFLAKARGKAMAAPKTSPNDNSHFDAGGMLAVKADAALVEEEAKFLSRTIEAEITVANLNSDKQVVLAGSKQAILKANNLLQEKGYSVVLLPVSAAFHTPLMGHAQKPFAEAARMVQFHSPNIPVYSNTTGSRFPTDPQAIRSILEQHILKPVLFKTEIEKTYENGGRIYIEFGPKNVLTGLVSSILAEQIHATVALNASPKKSSIHQLQDGLVQLRVLGLEIRFCSNQT